MEKRFSERTITAQGRKIIGHAAVFNQTARVVVNGRVVTERIAPGAFKRTLREQRDVLCLADHDTTKVLGRTKSQTLRLREDAVGLAFEVDLPDTQAARDTLALAERGDLGGGSFGFVATRETWNADKTERTVHEAALFEVSVISSHAAYVTDVQARAAEQADPLTARGRRLRLLEIGGSQ
jgi:HK97 family phage prohead protease